MFTVLSVWEIVASRYMYHSIIASVSVFAGIMTNNNLSERNVRRPMKCYHATIERYFKWDVHTAGTCQNMCSYCCDGEELMTLQEDSRGGNDCSVQCKSFEKKSEVQNQLYSKDHGTNA